MKKFFSAFILFLIFGGNISYSQRLNAQNAVDLAIANNPRLKIYREKNETAELKYKSAWGNFFPSLNFEGGFTRLDSPIDLDLEPFRQLIINLQANNQVELRNIYNRLGGNPTFTPAEKNSLFKQYYGLLNSSIPLFNMTLKEQNFRTGTFTAVQPLFLGGKLIAYKNYRKSEMTYAEKEYEKVKNEIISETVDAFLKVALLKEIVRIRENAVETIKMHKKNAEKLLKAGIIAKYNISKANVALAEAESKLSEYTNKLTLAKIALGNLLGTDNYKNIDVDFKFVLKETNLNLDSILNESEKYQPVLKMIDSKLKSAEANYNIQRSDFLPQIAAFGMKEIYPEDLSILEPKWAVGVQFKWNIFNGFKDYLELQEAEHLRNEAIFTKEYYKRRIKLWVNKSFADYLNANGEYKKAGFEIETAKENLRINRKRFAAGMGSSLEVVDAQLSLEKANVNKSLIIYKYYSALNNLFTAAGKPEEILKYLN